MTPGEMIFLNTEELIQYMDDLSTEADRGEAHRVADNILLVGLLRAASDDMTEGQAHRLINFFIALDRFYG